ncbi:aldehyde dehydrogenase family protein [Botrimarina hoheduenensis]|nr:aldehyde dehydrogenase family protein [Botrimarina hoheduenensis]
MASAAQNAATIPAIDAARAAQTSWRRLSPRQRIDRLLAVRRAIGTDPQRWANVCTPPQDRTNAESLAAEVAPLADAVQWLKRYGAATLKQRHAEGSRFGWLRPGSLTLVVERKPLGVVLVIGASNYPLFLLAVPALQALAAGNAALLKPPPGGAAAAALLHETLVVAGVDPRLCPVLASTREAAEEAIDAGVDHVVVTGSAETGRAVARSAAERLTSCTLECSGNDAMVVLNGANLDRVAVCLAWGLMLNSGATCIAPRRVILGADQIDDLLRRLKPRLRARPARRITERVAQDVVRLVGEAITAGATVEWPEKLDLTVIAERHTCPPIVLRHSANSRALDPVDLFGPVATLTVAETDDERVAAANRSAYALGASVFGPPGFGEADERARELLAGCVTLEDVIALTADARVPFGGTGSSGYGVTRGREGLLNLTRPQAIVRRHGDWLPHLDPETAALPDLIAAMIQTQHAPGLAARWRAVRRFLQAAKLHQQQKKERT